MAAVLYSVPDEGDAFIGATINCDCRGTFFYRTRYMPLDEKNRTR